MQRLVSGLVLPVSLAAALALLLVPAAAGAMLVVQATVTPSGATFDYDITITNGLADDVILISVLDAPLGDGLISASLTAPGGYAALYDPGLGIVDFAEAALFFAAGETVGGFAFSSSSAPGPGVFESFEAFTLGLDTVNGTVQVTLVPEPGTAALLALGLVTLPALRRRRVSRASALALVALVAAGSAEAASHSDAPLIKQDPQANITDVYTFVGTKYDDQNEKVLNVVVATRPFSEPGDGVIYDRFADDAQYSIHIANPATGEMVLRYDFQFSSVNPQITPGLKNRNTILSYGRGTEIGAIQDIGDTRQNFSQSYAVNKLDTSGSTIIGSQLLTPPPNVGRNVTPSYNDDDGRAVSGAVTLSELDSYTRQAIQDLDTGEAVFAGPREDGFYADIPAIFDLLDGRLLDNDGDPSNGLGQDGGGVDGFKGYNVLAYGIQIPVEQLSDVPFSPLVGVYATVSRRRVTLRSSTRDPRNLGAFVQVNRMGNPLFNEAFVPLKDKDTYNA